MPHVHMCALTLCSFYVLISTQTSWRALTVSVNRCMEIKSVSLMV